jgi:hypothetical protein
LVELKYKLLKNPIGKKWNFKHLKLSIFILFFCGEIFYIFIYLPQRLSKYCCFLRLWHQKQGYVSKTKTGHECQNWNMQYPHKHGFNIGRHNHCRNPDGSDEPWCYNTVKNYPRYNYCNVRKCKQCDKGKKLSRHRSMLPCLWTCNLLLMPSLTPSEDYSVHLFSGFLTIL